LFAILRQRAGVDQFDLEVPSGTTAIEASRAVAARMPALADLVPKTALAVNREYADGNRQLVEGDELALLPAVSGGA